MNRFQQEMLEFGQLIKTKPAEDGYPTSVVVLYVVILYALLYLLFGLEVAP